MRKSKWPSHILVRCAEANWAADPSEATQRWHTTVVTCIVRKLAPASTRTTRRSVAALAGHCWVGRAAVRVLAISLRQTACTVRPSMRVKSFGLRVYTGSPLAIAVAAISAS
jgi:hypothetical protein